MKKQIRGLLLGTAMVGVLALAGCSGSAPDGLENITEGSVEEYVQAAKDALAGADSFAADFEANVTLEGSGKTSTKGTVTQGRTPLHMAVETVMAFDGTEQKYDIYLEEGEETVNQYMNYDGEWTEMTLDQDAALTGVRIYDTAANLQTFLNAAEGWELKEDGGKVILTAVIPEAKFYAVEESGRLFQMAGMSGLSEVYFSGVGDVPVTLTLDSKTGAPVSYSIDLAKALETVTNNVLTELSGGTLEHGVVVEAYNITSALTQLGDVEATPIPEEAKSSAINYEKEITLLESAE
ncbi:MAG: hypothetical protein IJY52_05535 [Anaerotignum sp.]|nr:hypothetical protein [Anaerotignum sp.]